MSAENDKQLYYEHSGRKGTALPLAILIGIPAILLLSAVYSYIVVYCPVVGYVNLLFLGGFVLAGGFLIHKIAAWGKCRSEGFMMLIGFLLGCIALYFSWVFFLKALIGEVSLGELIAHPMDMWHSITAINAMGWWGPKGIAQWALVAVEAVVIVGGLTLAGATSIAELVFCEDCGAWCKPIETTHLRKDPEVDPTAHPSGNLALLGLEEATAEEYPRYDADILQCPSCRAMQAIRFFDVTQKLDDGELKEEREAIPGVLVQKG